MLMIIIVFDVANANDDDDDDVWKTLKFLNFPSSSSSKTTIYLFWIHFIRHQKGFHFVTMFQTLEKKDNLLKTENTLIWSIFKMEKMILPNDYRIENFLSTNNFNEKKKLKFETE